MFNWQQKGWPKARVDKAALKDELDSFRTAFANVKDALRKPQDPKAVMSALVDEAITTSAIEGVRIDESVVMSSICKALGMTNIPFCLTKDIRAEGVAQMVLAGKGKATIERAVAALIAAGKIEHRGSKKTGGYYPI